MKARVSSTTGGISIFAIGRSILADWRRMQQRIVDLMASFEVRDTSS